jgi:hypothetical protein
MQRLYFKTGRTRANLTGQLIHADVFGPMHVPKPSRAHFFVLFTDGLSGWCHVCSLKHGSEVWEFFNDYVSLLRSLTGNKYTYVYVSDIYIKLRKITDVDGVI